ncbi:UDP-N-acetylmuramate--alanine ligase [Leptospirillum ferriphilum]|uniref:UDP-N-acetylmuramate--L-alanine ligase n=1 Tax=Leptospirillum ferriphilum TaxID=178606 RepID=A0A094WA51_9BACT|nr:UDP-N-acetylmuramate--alanine ligase [Leptospirillum ferriphilum]
MAEILLSRGALVSGSDKTQTDLTRRLSELGARVFVGHRAEQVGSVDAVVISTAISPENPELLEARRLGIPVVHRGEALSGIMRGFRGVAVAGSHGKTTTTSMIAHVLAHGGLDPTCVVGGRVPGFGGNARVGKKNIFVAEADESDGSFLKISPHVAVVTNIDQEHLDYYQSFDQLKAAFERFLASVPPEGLAVVCLDDPELSNILPSLNAPHWTYGFNPSADVVGSDVSAEGLSTSFSVRLRGKDIGSFSLNIPGVHNVLNALATIAVGHHFGLEAECVREALERFRGVGRRFTQVGEEGGIRIVDDYGHHPTEIGVTLAAARQAYPDRRLVVAFQPHRFSRTRDLLSRFASAFQLADVLVLGEIYGAGESPIAGITGRRLFDEIRVSFENEAYFAADQSEMIARLMTILKPGDLLMTMGAGDVTHLGGEVLARLRQSSRVVG